MLLPDPQQLARMVEDFQTLGSRLNHMSTEEIAQDLADLHVLLNQLRRDYGSVQGFVGRIRSLLRE